MARFRWCLTGIANYKTLGTDSPVADALKALGYNRLRLIVTAGALMGMISSLLVYQYGQARIWFAMSRDRLLPKLFSVVHERFRTPYISTWIAGFVVGIPAGIWDIDTFAELSNIGTLFAFVLVSAGVIVLRKKQPERPRSFRCPWVPWLPAFSIVCCVSADDGAAHPDVDTIFRVADHRPGDLLLIQPKTKRAGGCHQKLRLLPGVRRPLPMLFPVRRGLPLLTIRVPVLVPLAAYVSTRLDIRTAHQTRALAVAADANLELHIGAPHGIPEF